MKKKFFVFLLLAGLGTAIFFIKNENTRTQKEREENEMEKITLQIGNREFIASPENNETVSVLLEQIPLTIEMEDYSGFEKVGSLGMKLPSNDRQMTTNPGDIVLYKGNQIVIFYGSNSWSYTKIGTIDDLSGWKEALGKENVIVSFSKRERNI